MLAVVENMTKTALRKVTDEMPSGDALKQVLAEQKRQASQLTQVQPALEALHGIFAELNALRGQNAQPSDDL